MTRSVILTVVAVAIAACGGPNDAKAPERQITLPPAGTAQPQLKDTPPAESPKGAQVAKAPQKKKAAPEQKAPAPEPIVETPRPQAPPPAAVPVPAATTPITAPPTGTIASGTSLTLKPAARVCTNATRNGDRFTAAVAAVVTGTNGVQVPAGAVAVFRVTDAVAHGDTLSIGYEIMNVRVGDETYEVAGHVAQRPPLERVNTQSTTDKATKVGAGAVIGAIAGRVLGGNARSTVLGGAVGAVAGGAVAATTGTYIGCLSENAMIGVVLDKPLVIRVASKP